VLGVSNKYTDRKIRTRVAQFELPLRQQMTPPRPSELPLWLACTRGEADCRAPL